jgi:hypothetical protein
LVYAARLNDTTEFPSSTTLPQVGNMAPTEDEKYQPKDAVSHGVNGATITGSIGLLMAAVKNSLEKANVGPWTTFTRHGHIIFTFGTASSFASSGDL